MRKPLLLLSFCLALQSFAAAHAQLLQQRPLPANGERGRIGAPQPLPLVQIGNRVLRLAPGGVIYDQQNRSIVHAHLPAGADVFYTRDVNGEMQRIYILTPDEQSRLTRAGKR